MVEPAPLYDSEELSSYVREELEPDISHLIIEDGLPVDNIFSEKQQQLLVESLDASVGEELRPLVALANVGLFASPNLPPLVPDVMVAFGKTPPGPLSEKKNKSYLIWNYGSPPDVVIEIVSNTEGGEDSLKLKKYAEWRVGYYVIYDPFSYLGSRPLRCYQLRGTHYVEALDPFKLQDFGLGFVIEEGHFRGYDGPWLRWIDSQGALLLTGVERAETEKARAEAERARAEAEKARAESEKTRAESEKTRAELAEQKAQLAQAETERLRAKLRELGLDS